MRRTQRIGGVWFAVWYLCIGIGFAVLALRAYILGAPPGGVILRLIIAVGFVVLAWVQYRQRGRPKRN